MIDSPLANGIEQEPALLLAVLGDDVGHLAAGDFLGRPAQQTFGGRVPQLDLAVEAEGDDGQGRRQDHCLQRLIGFAEGLFAALAFGDVAGDAEGADDLALHVAERHLAGRYPGLAAVGPGFFFLLAEQRLPAAHHLFLVLECLPRVFFGEEVEIAAADEMGRIGPVKVTSEGLIYSGKAAQVVLEVNRVGDVVHQRPQQVPLLDQLLPGPPAVADVDHGALQEAAFAALVQAQVLQRVQGAAVLAAQDVS